jgi:hypothetical protein
MISSISSGVGSSSICSKAITRPAPGCSDCPYMIRQRSRVGFPAENARRLQRVAGPEPAPIVVASDQSREPGAGFDEFERRHHGSRQRK